jgi:hypothetical protein
MESALKQEFYTHALSPTARDPNRLDPMVAAMTRARISFDGAGAGTEITTADQRLAADALNRQVMTLIRAWDRQ